MQERIFVLALDAVTTIDIHNIYVHTQAQASGTTAATTAALNFMQILGAA